MPDVSKSGSNLLCRNRNRRADARGAISRSRRTRSLKNAGRLQQLFKARPRSWGFIERGDKGVILFGAQGEFVAIREGLGGSLQALIQNKGADGLAFDRCCALKHRFRLECQTYFKPIFSAFHRARHSSRSLVPTHSVYHPYNVRTIQSGRDRATTVQRETASDCFKKSSDFLRSCVRAVESSS